MFIAIAMTVMAGGDTLELRDSTEGHAAELFYSNTGGQESTPGVYVLEHNGIRISVHLYFERGTSREEITVVDMDGLYIALPETIAVADGEETVVQILLPMY